MGEMKKRWISLYVENHTGVLAKISGLFSAKAYNLESLTVGATDDVTISRMTIGLLSDDATFEQIKKQLNRCVEVIKVIDFTTCPIISREILFIKLKNCSKQKLNEAYRVAQVYGLTVIDYSQEAITMQCLKTEEENDEVIKIFKEIYTNLEVIRGGSVAIEKIHH